MIRNPDLGRRSRVTAGGRLVAAVCLALLALGSVVLLRDLGMKAWFFFGIALAGLVALVFWRVEIPAGEVSADDIVDAARRALREEAARLDEKRLDLEKRVMAYGEWMEFPDFEELRTADWTAVAKSEQDEVVADLLARESDAMLARFSDGTYFTEGRFQGRALLLDLYSYIEKIARVYQPDSERPLLETNLEALLKAINRASLQVILLLEELPLVEVKELNIRQVSERVRQANTVYRKVEELQPFLDPVRYLWHGSKFLLASNPLLAAGWIAGSELIWKGGKHLGRKALDAYLLRLVRQSLGIIAWETATIYDRTHRYRNPDWVFAVELTHLASQFELTRDVLHECLREIGRIPLKSSYDRIFLYRCVARHVSPKPERFAQSDLLSPVTREEIRVRLEDFLAAHLGGQPDTAVARWRLGLAERLGLETDGEGKGDGEGEGAVAGPTRKTRWRPWRRRGANT